MCKEGNLLMRFQQEYETPTLTWACDIFGKEEFLQGSMGPAELYLQHSMHL